MELLVQGARPRLCYCPLILLFPLFRINAVSFPLERLSQGVEVVSWAPHQVAC